MATNLFTALAGLKGRGYDKLRITLIFRKSVNLTKIYGTNEFLRVCVCVCVYVRGRWLSATGVHTCQHMYKYQGGLGSTPHQMAFVASIFQ